MKPIINQMSSSGVEVVAYQWVTMPHMLLVPSPPEHRSEWPWLSVEVHRSWQVGPWFETVALVQMQVVEIVCKAPAPITMVTPIEEKGASQSVEHFFCHNPLLLARFAFVLIVIYSEWLPWGPCWIEPSEIRPSLLGALALRTWVLMCRPR